MNTEDLNFTCGGNNTALHLATFFGCKEIVKALLKRGADRNIKVKDVLLCNDHIKLTKTRITKVSWPRT